MHSEDTIIAKSTAPGGAARGVIRLSGPVAAEALRDFFSPFPENLSRCLVRSGSIYPWQRNRPVPARLFFWPEGRGYTGRQTVEIHTLGSPPILDAIVSALCRSQRIRPARPGEFTMQAFLAGRIDLTQAEAVLGIIDAPDRDFLAGALNQLAGGIATSLNEIREPLFDAMAHLEAGLDFADEDIDFITPEEIRRVIDAALERTDDLLRRMQIRHLSDDKPLVVLTGPPNSGKSTLFNKLLGDDRAIVSPQTGTTRDYLEADAVFAGLPLRLVDTAGYGEGSPFSGIDEKSIYLSRKRIDRADLRLECRENSDPFPSSGNAPAIHVRTKADLAGIPEETSGSMLVSSRSGQGVERLRSVIASTLRRRSRSCDIVPDTALRCRDLLLRARASLNRSRSMLEPDELLFDETILASEIRDALNHLGAIDGSVHAANLLDRIFGRFCIGK